MTTVAAPLFASAQQLPSGLTDLAAEVASRQPGLRLLDGDREMSAGEFEQRVIAVAGGLSSWGVRPGDRVAISMHNCLEWLETWFAVARLGAILVPINTRFVPAEAEFVLRHSRTAWVVYRPGQGPLDAEVLADMQSRGPDFQGCAVHGGEPSTPRDIRFSDLDGAPVPSREDGDAAGLIQYTSGSTAFPKGAMLRNRGLIRNGYGLGMAWQYTPRDHVLLSNPLFHCGGTVFGFMAGYVHGADITLLDSWRVVDGARLIDDHGITIAPVIDAASRDLYSLAHDTGRRFPTLRLVATAADGDLLGPVARELDCEISNVYGLTESSPNVCVGYLEDPLELRLSHTGRPQPGMEVVIRELGGEAPVPAGAVGEITIRGWALMLGYFDDPEATKTATTSDGFFRTGDLGTLDETGYVTYQGRAKLMIKSGGENVSIEEVEAALRSHPALADAVVVPIPDPRFGEVGYAFLRRHASEVVGADEVLAHCRTRIARFKVPKRAEIVDELPTMGSGKVDRRSLTELAQERLAAAGG